MGTTDSRTRRLLLLSPLLFAALTLLHPAVHPRDLESADRWLVVHVLQLVLLVPLAYCVWALLRGLPGLRAQLARVSVTVFVICFAAFDAVSGLATGWLVRTGEGADAPTRDALDTAIEALFDDNWLTGNDSLAAWAGSVAWLVVAIAGALALRQAGADRVTVGMMAGSLLLAVGHPPPFGTAGLLLLWGAAVRWDRRRPRGADEGPPTAAGSRVPLQRRLEPGALDSADRQD